MKQITSLKLAGLLALGLATTFAVHAQDNAPRPAREPRGEHRGFPLEKPALLKALDADGNEIIDATELANAPAAVAKADLNKDGQITADEMRPPRPGSEAALDGGEQPEPPQDHPKCAGPACLRALDANGDEVISADEIAKSTESLKTLDKNNDGVLTFDEYLGAPPHGVHGGPDEGRPHGRPPGK